MIAFGSPDGTLMVIGPLKVICVMPAPAGAAAIGMKRFYGHLLAKDAMTNPNLWPFPAADPLAEAGILVDARGMRFADEGEGGEEHGSERAGSGAPGGFESLHRGERT